MPTEQLQPVGTSEQAPNVDLVQNQTSLNKEDEKQIVLSIIEALFKLKKFIERYPEGHQFIVNVSEEFAKSLRMILIVRNNLVLTVLNEKLYIDDDAYVQPGEEEDSALNSIRERKQKRSDEDVKDLIASMVERRIKRIIFWQGLSPHELILLTKILIQQPEEVLDAGGVRLLLEDLSVSRIEVVESKYQRLGDESGETWEMRLSKHGLEVGEITALLSGKSRIPRILTDEIILLVEAMKDPSILAQLIMRAAMETENTQGEPDAYELVRICKRLPYVLGMASGGNIDFYKMLSDGLLALPRHMRLNILQLKHVLEANGVETLDEELFVFQEDEIAEYLVRRFEATNRWELGLPIGVEAAYQLGLSVENRLYSSDAVDDSREFNLTPTSINKSEAEHQVAQKDFDDLEDRLANVSKRLRSDLAFPVLRQARPQTFKPLDELATKDFNTDQYMAEMRSRLSENLTDGYMYVLINLFLLGEDSEWCSELADRLAIITEARLELSRFKDVAAMLTALQSVELPEGKQKLFQNSLQDVFQRDSELLAYLLVRIRENDENAYKSLHFLLRIFQISIWNELLEMLIEGSSAEPYPLVLRLIKSHAGEFRDSLENLLSDPSADRRLKGLEVLRYFQGAGYEKLVAVSLEDDDKHIRFAAITTCYSQALVAMRSLKSKKDVGKNRAKFYIQLLRSIVEEEKFDNRDQMAAMYFLGRLHTQSDAPLLKGIMRKLPLISPKDGVELRQSAALALRNICSLSSLEILHQHGMVLGESRLTLGFKTCIRWAVAKYFYMLRLVKKVAKWIVKTAIRFAKFLYLCAKKIGKILYLVLCHPFVLLAKWIAEAIVIVTSLPGKLFGKKTK